MNCKHCGHQIESYETHQCNEGVAPVFKPTPNFNMPKVPSPSSKSKEITALTLSGKHPDNITIEEVLSARTQLPGFIKEIKTVFSIWKRFFKKPTKQNIILIIIGVITFILWVWTKYLPGSFNYMAPTGIKAVFAFLLASFNNIPARVLHYSSVATLVAAFLPALLSGQFQKITSNFKGTFILIQKMLSYKNGKTLHVCIIAFGMGMFFSNYLMRNNSVNKYLVCLTLGLTILLSTSGLFNSTFIRLSKGLYNDVMRVFKLQKHLYKYQIAIQLGFGGGLISSFLACIIRGMSSNGFTDNFAYYFGAAIIIAGIALLLKPGNSSGKPI